MILLRAVLGFILLGLGVWVCVVGGDVMAVGHLLKGCSMSALGTALAFAGYATWFARVDMASGKPRMRLW